jgi:hypothetical protein
MKNCLNFMQCAILQATLLMINLNSLATTQPPDLSIITDKSPGLPVTHGLTKLTDALRPRNVSFEEITSLNEARGKWLIVSGLSSGQGAAARILKEGNHAVPNVSEALTIRKTAWQNKPAWVISGYDDRGLMYGLLDVAQRVGWNTNAKSPMREVKEITEKPDVSERPVSI